MTHVLAVYTVLYVAILFTTVGIWAGDIASATGDFRVLLFSLGAFSLKLAIDDYVHFSKKRQDIETSLTISLAIYLLLAGSIANAALARPRLAAILFCLVFVAGAAWILIGDNTPDADDPDRLWRHRWWLAVNTLSASLLGWTAYLGLQRDYSPAAYLLTILLIVIVTDFLALGTLGRLAAEAERSDIGGQGGTPGNP